MSLNVSTFTSCPSLQACFTQTDLFYMKWDPESWKETGKKRTVMTCRFRGHSFGSVLLQGPPHPPFPCLVNLQSLITLHLKMLENNTHSHKLPKFLLRPEHNAVYLPGRLCECQVNHGLWELMIQWGRLCSLVAASDIYSIMRRLLLLSHVYTKL